MGLTQTELLVKIPQYLWLQISFIPHFISSRVIEVLLLIQV